MQPQILAIFYFYMLMKQYKLCIKTFLQSVCACGTGGEQVRLPALVLAQGPRKECCCALCVRVQSLRAAPIKRTSAPRGCDSKVRSVRPEGAN